MHNDVQVVATRVKNLADLRSTIPTVLRGFLAAFLAVAVGLGVYIIGLFEPLTPSEGRPTTIALLIFVGIPLIGVTLSALLVESRTVRLFLALEALLILGFSIFLVVI